MPRASLWGRDAFGVGQIPPTIFQYISKMTLTGNYHSKGLCLVPLKLIISITFQGSVSLFPFRFPQDTPAPCQALFPPVVSIQRSMPFVKALHYFFVGVGITFVGLFQTSLDFLPFFLSHFFPPIAPLFVKHFFEFGQ